MKRNVLSTLFIIIGISLIITSLGLRIYSKNKESRLIEEFNKEIKIENNNKKQCNNIKYVNNEGDKIAIMEIPSLTLKSIIVQGTNMNDLKYYLGHFEDTAMPGGNGNFCIAGHSSTVYNEILNNLYKVNVNDQIKIQTLTEKFTYVINEKFVVEPTKIDVLDQDNNIKEMTIVTCTDKGKKRLIVKAKLKE